jgi:phosphoglycolate phosphatase
LRSEIQNVLFDLDGTLVDSSHTIGMSIDFALERMAVENARDKPIESMIGRPLLDIFHHEFNMTDDQAYQAIDIYRDYYDSLNQQGTDVYESIRDVLPALQKAGYRLFVATVKPTPIADKVLKDLDLRSCFDGVSGASMGPKRRDKSSIIAHAVKTFGLDPVQSIMIGDRDQDILGARENGMEAIGVTYGFGSREELSSADPAHLVDHSEQIINLLVNPDAAE